MMRSTFLLCSLSALLLCTGCEVIHVDLGVKKDRTLLAIAEPSEIAILDTDAELDCIVTVQVNPTTTQQMQSTKNLKGCVVLPKSDFRDLKGLAYPQMKPVSVEVPLAGAEVTLRTIIVEVGEPVEIATDAPLKVLFPSAKEGGEKIPGTQNCAGMYAIKVSVYRALKAKAFPKKETIK